jgi:hypothetical protein
LYTQGLLLKALHNFYQLKPMVKYFKVTSDRFDSPAYYAAHNLNDAKEVAYSDTNSQMLLNFEEVQLTDIPSTSVIHTAKLGRVRVGDFMSQHSANPKITVISPYLDGE